MTKEYEFSPYGAPAVSKLREEIARQIEVVEKTVPVRRISAGKSSKGSSAYIDSDEVTHLVKMHAFHQTPEKQAEEIIRQMTSPRVEKTLGVKKTIRGVPLDTVPLIDTLTIAMLHHKGVTRKQFEEAIEAMLSRPYWTTAGTAKKCDFSHRSVWMGNIQLMWTPGYVYASMKGDNASISAGCLIIKQKINLPQSVQENLKNMKGHLVNDVVEGIFAGQDLRINEIKMIDAGSHNDRILNYLQIEPEKEWLCLTQACHMLPA